MRKFWFVSGLAVGYVVGTRAGRRRYLQIKSAAQSVWNMTPVQNTVGAAKDFALDHAGDLGESALGLAKKLVRVATQGAERTADVAEEALGDASDAVSEAAKKQSASSSAKSATAKSATAKPAARKPAAKKPAASRTARSGAAAKSAGEQASS